MKSKVEIYALSVCFSCVFCLVVSISVAGYSLIEISNPELTMRAYEYEKFQSNDVFWERVRRTNSDDPKPDNKALSQRRANEFKISLASESREGLQTLIKSSIFVFVSAIVLFVHWRIIVRFKN